MKKKKKCWNVELINIVNEWLKKNRPDLYVDKTGAIGLVSEKGMQSQAFGTVYYGGVGDTYVEFLNPFNSSERNRGLTTTVINAADPEFFEKLAKHLK
jgi:hypothetical protein